MRFFCPEYYEWYRGKYKSKKRRAMKKKLGEWIRLDPFKHLMHIHLRSDLLRKEIMRRDWTTKACSFRGGWTSIVQLPLK